MKYHPDRAPKDKKKEYEAKFKEIGEAYNTL
jgi:curved DNA-binding protein CbpA